MVVRVELPAHASPIALLNELRVGDTRRTVGRTAARARRRPRRRRSSLPGIPSTAQFPEHAADVPHRRLSAARIAAEHRDRLQHQRDAGRRHADLVEGAAHASSWAPTCDGSGSNVVQPPSPTGSFTFSNLFTDLPGTANTGTPLASFLLGQVQQFSIDLQQDADPQPRALPGVLRPGRLAAVRSRHGQRRPALHAEFPVDRGERPGGGLQPGDAAARVSRARRPAARGAAAAQAQFRPAPRRRRAPHRQDGRRATGYGAGLDRDGGHHDAVHDAGLSVPADRVAAHARQHHAGVRARERAARRADSADADRRPRPGRVRRRPRPRLRLRAAVERVACSAS